MQVLLDTKTEYIDHLLDIITIPLAKNIYKLYDTSSGNIKVFQQNLVEIKNWNNNKIYDEYQLLLKKTKCNYLDKLLKEIVMLNIKIKTENKTKIKDIVIIKPYDFIHKCMINIGIFCWKNVYLFSTKNLKPSEKQYHLNLIEKNIRKILKNTIRDITPFETILEMYKKIESSEEEESSEEDENNNEEEEEESSEEEEDENNNESEEEDESSEEPEESSEDEEQNNNLIKPLKVKIIEPHKTEIANKQKIEIVKTPRAKIIEPKEEPIIKPEEVIIEPNEEPIIKPEEVIIETNEEPIIKPEEVINETNEEPIIKPEEVINETNEEPIIKPEEVINEESEDTDEDDYINTNLFNNIKETNL